MLCGMDRFIFINNDNFISIWGHDVCTLKIFHLYWCLFLHLHFSIYLTLVCIVLSNFGTLNLYISLFNFTCYIIITKELGL